MSGQSRSVNKSLTCGQAWISAGPIVKCQPAENRFDRESRHHANLHLGCMPSCSWALWLPWVRWQDIYFCDPRPSWKQPRLSGWTRRSLPVSRRLPPRRTRRGLMPQPVCNPSRRHGKKMSHRPSRWRGSAPREYQPLRLIPSSLSLSQAVLMAPPKTSIRLATPEGKARQPVGHTRQQHQSGAPNACSIRSSAGSEAGQGHA
jgi:hypothetical protein